MQPGALRALEFDRIVEAVRRFALTPMGDGAPGRLQPSTDPQRVAELLARTTEAARFLAANGGLPLRASDDLPQILAALAVEGRALEALRLLALAAFLDSVDESRAAIRRAPGSFPRLEAVSGGAASFKSETARRATRSTRRARSSITRARSSRPFASGCASSGRGCAARSSRTCAARRRRSTCRIRSSPSATAATCSSSGPSIAAAIPGIVHGASTSGASLFLEPLSTVEINNDIVALEEQEREEVRRILLALTDAFRARRDDLQRTIEAATELDVRAGARAVLRVD